MIPIRFPRLSSRTRPRSSRTAVRLMRPGRLRGMRDLLFLFLAFSFLVRPAAATIEYKISLAHPEQHVFHVTITVPNATANETARIPAWNALYQIRDFAYRVQDVRVAIATSGESVQRPLNKIDKQTWEFGHGRDALITRGTLDLIFTYSIQWDDPGPFNSQLNAHHAFLNFAEVA